MDIPAGSPTREFTCAGQTLTIGNPFAEGYVLNTNESQSLFQLLIENSRNNFAAQCKKLVEDGKNIGEIQEIFTGYLNGYEFGVRRGRNQIIDPVAREAYALAKKKVEGKLKKDGVKLADLEPDTLDTYVKNALEKYPHFMESAQRIVDERDAVDAEIEIS